MFLIHTKRTCFIRCFFFCFISIIIDNSECIKWHDVHFERMNCLVFDLTIRRDHFHVKRVVVINFSYHTSICLCQKRCVYESQRIEIIEFKRDNDNRSLGLLNMIIFIFLSMNFRRSMAIVLVNFYCCNVNNWYFIGQLVYISEEFSVNGRVVYCQINLYLVKRKILITHIITHK